MNAPATTATAIRVPIVVERNVMLLLYADSGTPMKVATEREAAMMEKATAQAGMRRPARKYSRAPAGSRRANQTPEPRSSRR